MGYFIVEIYFLFILWYYSQTLPLRKILRSSQCMLSVSSLSWMEVNQSYLATEKNNTLKMLWNSKGRRLWIIHEIYPAFSVGMCCIKGSVSISKELNLQIVSMNSQTYRVWGKRLTVFLYLEFTSVPALPSLSNLDWWSSGWVMAGTIDVYGWCSVNTQ